MKELVTFVGQYGFKTESSGEEWIGISKFAKGVTLDGVEKGVMVDYDAKTGNNGKRYASRITVLGHGATAEAASEPAALSSPSAAPRAPRAPLASAGLSDTAARAAAVQAAFGPALEAFLTKAETVSDAVEQAEALANRLTRYINTGKFEEAQELANV